ncbi:MAG: sugar ABC transporter substrate-binding protein [Gemmatimonadales bacterium]
MTLRSRALLWLLVSLAVVSCRSPEERGENVGAADRHDATARAESPRVVLVTHGQSADPFWSVVATGARDAGAELGVRVEYQAPGTFNMVEMSQLIDAVAASRPEGLAVSIPDGDALAPSIRAAAAAGIPIVSINSGALVFRDLGLRAHVGQPERDAGLAAGRRMAEAGVTRVLCVNHEVGNIALDSRCAGLEDGLREADGSVQVLAVDLADPEDAQQRIRGALAREPGIDGVLTLGPAGAVPALAAVSTLRESNALDETLELATFDLSLPVLEAIREGEMSFAVDQQPYLQGYLAVVLLHKAAQIGALPDGVIRTGPAFVTSDNAAEVIRLVGRGVR